MQLLNEGWTLGICGRREERLEEIRMQYPGKVFTQVLDITSDDAPTELMGLVERMGGINLYLHVSGIGFMNKELDTGKEARTADTNVKGFTQMMTRCSDISRTTPASEATWPVSVVLPARKDLVLPLPIRHRNDTAATTWRLSSSWQG